MCEWVAGKALPEVPGLAALRFPDLPAVRFPVQWERRLGEVPDRSVFLDKYPVT